MIESKFLDRIQKHAREWGVAVADTFQTESSVIAFGTRDNLDVVLKIIKQPGDEWYSGRILEAFNGNGFARVYEHAPGAVLLERLRPGTPLVDLALNDRDEEATGILADIMRQISSFKLVTSESESTTPEATLPHWPTVQDWAKGFDRYRESGDEQIPKHLVDAGQRLFLDLCASQQRPGLLHGDLQHYNVLFDSARGWLAIDPKGVLGDRHYDVSNVFRNPDGAGDLAQHPDRIDALADIFAARLGLDRRRLLQWAAAHCALSECWNRESGDEGTFNLTMLPLLLDAVDRSR